MSSHGLPFQSCELSHQVSVTAMRSWPCDLTQISHFYRSFPVLCAVVYRHFREVIKCADIPQRVQEAPPQPYTPSRWFAFWILFWEADKEHLSLLWWAWLIPQLDVNTVSLDALPWVLQFKDCFTKLASLLPEIPFPLLDRWMYIWNIFEGMIHRFGR